MRGLRTLLDIALVICYIGIAYQLPGAFTGERANLLTSHMKAMGLLDSARIISMIASGRSLLPLGRSLNSPTSRRFAWVPLTAPRILCTAFRSAASPRPDRPKRYVLGVVYYPFIDYLVRPSPYCTLATIRV
ncbi:hypothetical protein OG21DRAFT_946779 [Imleria badia]|nr:hypothetical protein OG21DRAFT_946779 [Imleria badia]